jgi:RNA polymerase sigma factor (sigma-70 family)
MYRQAEPEDLTPAQFEAAHHGFFGLLRRKRMSPAFIEHNGEDLFAQALYEYTRQLREGKEIRNPTAWIVVCAWHRTVGLLETRDWRPKMVSTERVGELPADATPAPEDEFLAEERYRKVREAVERLPSYQRQLLALSYFEGESVREAARKLEWTASKGQRAHEAARRRLLKLLGSMDELEIAAGLAAFLSLGPDGCAMHLQLIGGAEGVLDTVLHSLAHLAERGVDLLRRPLAGADHGPAALAARTGRRASDLGRRLYASGAVETSTVAADGGGRVAEACKALVVVCVIGGGAVTGGALLGAGHSHQRPQPQQRPVASTRAHPAPAAVQPSTSNDATTTTASTAKAATVIVAPSGGVSTDSSNAAQARPAVRRAQRHESEEASAEQAFGAIEGAAAEAEGASDTFSSGASSSAEPHTASTTGESGAAVSAPASPKERTEEAQTSSQFRGGLP